MTTLTLYMAGSGHGLDHDVRDDSMVDAYNNTEGHKAFFPGPGAGNYNIYVGPATYTNLDVTEENGGRRIIGANARIQPLRPSSARKRAVTGKGWNDNVLYALRLIAGFLDRFDSVTLNLAGHSRGSVTVIMLLNDMFHEHLSATQRDGFSVATTKKGKDTYRTRAGIFRSGPRVSFPIWYRGRLQAIWANRLGTVLAESGLGALDTIKQHQGKIAGVNAWLYDPVAGVNQGNTNRKQDFPDHPLIKRVRVLRMEHGSQALSTNMPTFAGWGFLSGQQSRNLAVYDDRERLVVPLPGSHGAGLSKNIENGQATTEPQWYIGSSYMVGLLAACGTHFAEGFADRWGSRDDLLNHYDTLMGAYTAQLPTKKRRAIHVHHTREGYAGGYVNAHHHYLAWFTALPEINSI